MSDALIGIILGIAALVAAFFQGKNTQKNKEKLKNLEENYEKSKLAEAIKAANDSIPDNDLRKWMRDNAKK